MFDIAFKRGRLGGNKRHFINNRIMLFWYLFFLINFDRNDQIVAQEVSTIRTR